MQWLQKLIEGQKRLIKGHRFLSPLYPLISAADSFLFEPAVTTSRRPHIRDAIDLKRWMILVVIALAPAIFMAVWNTGVQKLVYGSGNWELMQQYLTASASFTAYRDFVLDQGRYLTILSYGLQAFIPVVLISYTVGGLIEGVFAYIRGHEIAEGFLVTGILFPLVLPPTIPLWLVALGVAFGVIIGKELFGGTGMNILNPALTCRAFLFFGFPTTMSGHVWAGSNPTKIAQSVQAMEKQSTFAEVDAITQDTPLNLLNIDDGILNLQVDAIADNTLGGIVATKDLIAKQFTKWQVALEDQAMQDTAVWSGLSPEQLQNFVTAPLARGGLGLAPELYKNAYDFAALKYGIGHFNDATLFLGNHLGSMGETSTLACAFGAIFLICTRIASFRTILGVIFGALVTALCFNIACIIAPDHGAWLPARFSLPAYKHLLMGGLAFGLVFMATDPVSSPGHPWSRWIYGFLIGFLTIIIRLINPAYPEGIMLAILFSNVFAPLIDHYVLIAYRRRARAKALRLRSKYHGPEIKRGNQNG